MSFSDDPHASLHGRAIFILSSYLKYSVAGHHYRIFCLTLAGNTSSAADDVGFSLTIMSNLQKCYSLDSKSSYLCVFFLDNKPIAVLQYALITLLEDAFVIS